MGVSVIKVEDVSKQYRLGQVGTGSIAHDLNRWWHRALGKENPYLRIGETNDRSSRGNSDYVWALRDINFEVRAGEVWGVIGRNGAGKSTLLKILSRTTTPTAGSVRMQGRIASLLEVGTGMHPELTGRENIYLNGAILGMRRKEIDNKLDEIVDFSGVERYLDTPVKRYSSGMHVRLGFAVAAHLDPDILIVDEVLAVGDAEFQKKCLGKMQDVSTQQGRTVLFVSHNMTAVENLCKKGILMENGQISFTGNIIETVNYYYEQIQKAPSVSLKLRTDRVGEGPLKIIDFHLQNLAGQKIDQIKSGGDFYFVLDIENKNSEQGFRSVVGSVALSDERRQTILLIRSNFTNQNFNIDKPFCRVRSLVKNLAIANGNYSATVFLGHGETGIYDMVENAGLIEIRGGDYFGTGSSGLPHLCKNLLAADWEVYETVI